MTYSIVAILIIYFLISGFIIGALFTDDNTNTNWKEAILCVVVGLVWPLSFIIAAGVDLRDHLKKKRWLKRRQRQEALLCFAFLLYNFKIISKETRHVIQQSISEQ